MPGLVGILTQRPRPAVEPELARMVEALRHEPFYATGTWADETLGAYVGWIAHEGSFGDGMPLRNERGDTLLIAGEEFSAPETEAWLRHRGHRFHGDGSSYLVHLYEEAPDFLARLNGRFHGLLCDRHAGTATLFNDRYGMQRLYYHESADGLYFAAEAKALLAVRPELRRVDPRGLGEFIACGCVMDDRTLFRGVRLLPGAAAWVFRGGRLTARGAYFDRAAWESPSPLAPDAFYRDLRDVFTRNLPRYFGGSQRIAMSLTGGLDTRMIMAWQAQPPKALSCYTFGGMLRDCHDVRVAREVAAAADQPHEVIEVGDAFLAAFPRYAERTVYLADGCLPVSHTADLYVSERARPVAPVRMTGNYGGEVLRRVVAFKPERPAPGLFRPDLVPHLEAAEKTYAERRAGHPLAFAVFRQAPWYHRNLLALEDSQLSVRSPFLDNDLVRIVFRAPETSVTSDGVCLRLIADGHPALAGIATDRGIGGRRGLGAGLVRRLRDFSRKAEYAYDYGMPPIGARIDHALGRLHLERLFLGRHKFCHYRIWYRDALRDYVREMLLDRRTLARPYLEPTMVETVVAGHLAGRANYTTEIHVLLTLELMHRAFVDA
jgi:asparagine synthase (glutamine-hydrolysing)